MSDESKELVTLEEMKPRIMLTGAAIGLGLGLLSAYLLIRRYEEKGETPEINVGDTVRIGLTMMGLLRTISQL